MEGQAFSGTERRLHPRRRISGEVLFKAYWPSADHENGLYKHVSGYAELVDISSYGMRIKTSVPLDKRCILELNGLSTLKEMASVVWVQKINDSCQAGLSYIPK